MAEKDNLSSISKSSTIEEMADFWDTHDATDYEGETYEVATDFDIQFRSHYVAIDPNLLQGLRQVAASRGLSTESLINLWLQEKLLSPS
ncbi:MAG: CopG family antitoxin [Candidatus Promineifilaceae bacterium]